jgi:DNA polymerase elongation subunit (family B)
LSKYLNITKQKTNFDIKGSKYKFNKYMLVDYEYNSIGKQLIVSYINELGNIKLKYYPWANPTKFVITDDDDKDRSGKYTTWDGKSIKEVYTRYPNRYSVYNFLDSLPIEEQKMIFDYIEPEIFFIDIENKITDSKIQPEKADGEIQTISIVNKDKIMVLGTKKFTNVETESVKSDINNHFSKFKTNYDFIYKYYESEYDMMLNFFKLMIPKMAVLTGWNFIAYDWVYLVERAKKIGVDPTYASFTRILNKSFDLNDFSELPSHRIVVDYMDIYAKWDTSIKVKESKSLDFVSESILGIKKIQYEGNLTYLHENDYTKFVLYNAIDSALVHQIHLKMKYIDIMYGVATLSKIKATDAFNTLPITEGILREKLRNEKNIVFVKDESKKGDSMDVVGGWVKEPIVGMSSWTTCYDFSSLYPTTIREFNISADSYRGNVIIEKGKTVYDMIKKLRNDELVYSVFNGHKIELDSTDIVTLNGAVFKNEDGVVKTVMADIFAERKKYKKKMMTANDELNEMEKELESLKQQYGYGI